MDELTIQRIKDLIQQDDPGALDIVYDRRGKRLYHYVRGLLGAEPEAQGLYTGYKYNSEFGLLTPEES